VTPLKNNSRTVIDAVPIDLISGPALESLFACQQHSCSQQADEHSGTRFGPIGPSTMPGNRLPKRLTNQNSSNCYKNESRPTRCTKGNRFGWWWFWEKLRKGTRRYHGC
jgi:hypothetical protein